MPVFGKLLGIVLGYLYAGPLGVVFGILVGHAFDKGLGQALFVERAQQGGSLFFKGVSKESQRAYFHAVFTVMGHVAKVDGRITEPEVQMAREIMVRMGLSRDQTLQAMHMFNAGKTKNFILEFELDQLKKKCPHPILWQIFMDIQLQAAYADGALSASERMVLKKIAQHLRLGAAFFEQLDARYHAYQAFHHTQGPQAYTQTMVRDRLVQAYAVLGVEKHTSDQELKKAYRKLMSAHHPDKLAAKGLPPEMLKIATEKTRQIREAYEVICKERGMV